MKKHLLTVLFTMCMLTTLTACGSTDTDTSTTTTDTSTTETEDVRDNQIDELITPEVVTVNEEYSLHPTLIQAITDADLGMTGEEMVDFVVNYNDNAEDYRAKLTELYGPFEFDVVSYKATQLSEDLLNRGIEEIVTGDETQRTADAYLDFHHDGNVLAEVAPTVINEADWDAMKATWVEDETTYEEIVAQVGYPGYFNGIDCIFSTKQISVCFVWSVLDENGEYTTRGIRMNDDNTLYR